MAELGAFFGNPNIQRQGARARALAGQRDVNTLPDPLTYAVMQGLLGTRPDEMGFSVLNPDYEKIKKVAEPAFALGLLGQVAPAFALGLLGQAAPALAPLTKGLPVGASIKSLDDIFKKYPDVTIDASVGKKDINLSRIVVPKEMRNQGVGTQVMSDLSEYADNIGKRITLTPSSDFGGSVPKLKAFYKELGFVENKGKNKDFSTREAMYREPQPVDAKPSYPQQEALDKAQRNAALPVEEGGLGLPKDNTPEMRAEAMGFNLNEKLYHGTEGDFPAFEKSSRMSTYATEDPEIADIYAMSERRPNNASPNIIPLVARGNKLKVSDYEQSDMGSFNGGFFGNNVATALGIPWQRALTKLLPKYGYDRLEVTDMADLGGIQTQHMFPEPEVLRSRFAAFDPKRKNEADLLAGVLPLGLLADEEQRKKLYELMPSLLGQ